VLFDREDLFARSLPSLAKQMSSALPKPPPGAARGPATLTRTPLPDNSGWVSLAPGWRITGAYKGTVDAVGPDGEIMSLGGYQQVFNYRYPNMLYGPYRPPWPALELYIDILNKGAMSRGEAAVRLIEQVPDQYPGGQAAWISFETAAKGKTYRGLAWVATAPIRSDIASWFFYMSTVGAQSDLFARELPTLVAMWKSWGVSQAVFRERMDSALRSMRETYKIMQEAHDYQTKTYDNINFGWDETIRGVTMIEDVAGQRRGEVSTQNAQWIVDEMNRQGYNFRIVPLNELVP